MSRSSIYGRQHAVPPILGVTVFLEGRVPQGPPGRRFMEREHLQNWDVSWGYEPLKEVTPNAQRLTLNAEVFSCAAPT